MFCGSFEGQCANGMAEVVDEEFLAHEFMVAGGMVLGHIVRRVVCAWAPVDAELLLSYTVLDPMEPHIYSL